MAHCCVNPELLLISNAFASGYLENSIEYQLINVEGSVLFSENFKSINIENLSVNSDFI